MQKYLIPITFSLLCSATLVYSNAPAEKKTEAATDTASLAKEVEKLRHKIYALEKKEKEIESNEKSDRAKIDVLSSKSVSGFDEGFIAMSPNFGFKISGRIKLDGSYTPTGQAARSGAFLPIASIPLNYGNKTGAQSKQGNFNGTLQGSRLQIDTVSPTNSGDIKGTVLIDFFGPQNNATTFISQNGYVNTVKSSTNNSAEYGVRLRYAYLKFNDWTAGQLESNFADSEFGFYGIENFGFGVMQRRAQLRFSPTISPGFVLSVSVEKPNSDYVDWYGSQYGNEQYGKSGLPDFTMRLRKDGDYGFFSVGAIYRSLGYQVAKNDAQSLQEVNSDISTVKATQSVDFKTNGWGLSSGFRLNMPKSKSHLFGQVLYGNGLGYLVWDGNPAAAFIYPTNATTNAPTNASCNTIRTLNGVLGFRYFFTDDLHWTVAGTITRMKNPSTIPGAAELGTSSNQINKKLSRFVTSVSYSPVKNLVIATEAMIGRRKVETGYYGNATQITGSVIYLF